MPGLIGLWARSFGFMFGDYQALHPSISNASKEQVQRAHRVNRRVHVWTVNTPEEVTRLKDWGVDGIITDDPQMVALALGRSRMKAKPSEWQRQAEASAKLKRISTRRRSLSGVCFILLASCVIRGCNEINPNFIVDGFSCNAYASAGLGAGANSYASQC